MSAKYMMNVLVTYGSKMGSTAGLANMLAKGLRGEGLSVDVRPVELVDDLEHYDVVVVGSALYMSRWRSEARRFVKSNTDALRQRPVFFFSSGPLDDSASHHEIPPTKQVERLMRRVGAVDHTTFGGRLAEDPKGFVAQSMAKTSAGDWRDELQTRAWAARVSAYLDEHPGERFLEAERARPTSVLQLRPRRGATGA